jgi:hypothetical protein
VACAVRRRERAGQPNYPLGCCLLYTTATALGRQLRYFSLPYLDSLTSDDLLLLVARPEADTKDADDTVLMVARYLNVSLDALPCAVFFVASREHAERAILRLDAYIPFVDNEHVAKAMHAIAEAARRSAQAPDHERLVTVRKELTLAHQRTFPEAPEPAWPGAEGRQNVTAFASVLGALASAAGVALGR